MVMEGRRSSIRQNKPVRSSQEFRNKRQMLNSDIKYGNGCTIYSYLDAQIEIPLKESLNISISLSSL
jgi:hypothetical protein